MVVEKTISGVDGGESRGGGLALILGFLVSFGEALVWKRRGSIIEFGSVAFKDGELLFAAARSGESSLFRFLGLGPAEQSRQGAPSAMTDAAMTAAAPAGLSPSPAAFNSPPETVPVSASLLAASSASFAATAASSLLKFSFFNFFASFNFIPRFLNPPSPPSSPRQSYPISPSSNTSFRTPSLLFSSRFSSSTNKIPPSSLSALDFAA